MFYFDPLYLLIALPALLFAIVAQLIVKYVFSKYSKIANSREVSGAELVGKAASEYGLNLSLSVTPFDMNDHYNPLNGQLTLSEKVAHVPTIASVGIAAHEVGHAIQHQKGSFMIKIRERLMPIVNFSSTISYLLFILGLSLNIIGFVWGGVALFAVSTLFTFVTLPIEIDASKKAVKVMRDLDVLNEHELSNAKKVLLAASLTYVAAVAQSLSSLLYYILRAFGMRKRD